LPKSEGHEDKKGGAQLGGNTGGKKRGGDVGARQETGREVGVKGMVSEGVKGMEREDG